MHKQHPQTAYRKYAILIGTIFENCDKTAKGPLSAAERAFLSLSGVGAEIIHPCVVPGGQQMVAVRLGVFLDEVAVLVGQRLPEVQEGTAFSSAMAERASFISQSRSL